MFSKKAVGVGQVFVFIIAAITFALIMIFGYRAINSFLHSGESVQYVQFKTDLESSIKTIYTEYGSRRVETYTLPGEFTQICFVDMDYPPEKIDEEMPKLCEKDTYACSVWQDARDSGGYGSVDENVFIKPAKEGLTKIKVYKISIGDESGELDYAKGFLCENIVEGSFSLILEGRGDHTKLMRKVGR